jgi:hypothetical protein
VRDEGPQGRPVSWPGASLRAPGKGADTFAGSPDGAIRPALRFLSSALWSPLRGSVVFSPRLSGGSQTRPRPSYPSALRALGPSGLQCSVGLEGRGSFAVIQSGVEKTVEIRRKRKMVIATRMRIPAAVLRPGGPADGSRWESRRRRGSHRNRASGVPLAPRRNAGNRSPRAMRRLEADAFPGSKAPSRCACRRTPKTRCAFLVFPDGHGVLFAEGTKPGATKGLVSRHPGSVRWRGGRQLVWTMMPERERYLYRQREQK